MIKILFVCHGNICRSPMAEFIMRDIIRKHHCSDKFVINSRALSTEEIGNGMYPNAFKILDEKGILVGNHKACLISKFDFDNYDYIIVMDDYNLSNIINMFGYSDKVYKLLYFLGSNNSIDDPWYTRDFEKAYEDILKGCEALYTFLEKNNKIY